MATRNTRTAFTDVNGNNATKSHLATNIIIKAGNYVVGAVQTLNITESRDVKMIDEVGTDGHIDSAPSASTNISGNCTRVRFDKQRVAEAFGRSFTHVHAQRIPFDIEIHDIFADEDTNNAVITTIKNVWITEISYDYNATDWVISDKMSFKAEAIFSILANKNVVTGVANGQDGPIYLNQFEQEADRGVFRGALDAAGVLNAFIDDPTS
jgi:hypothetical protein